eukprot:14634037-Alexandrium_andersonii.AAC.1
MHGAGRPRAAMGATLATAQLRPPSAPGAPHSRKAADGCRRYSCRGNGGAPRARRGPLRNRGKHPKAPRRQSGNG